MTQLTLDNWREHLKDNRINSYDQITQGHIESLIELILALQKQSLKDEAVKRINDKVREYCDHDCNDCDVSRIAMEQAKDIIRNL